MNEIDKTKIRKGSKFLPGTSIKYLQECHKKEKNPKAANRLLAYIMRKEGRSIRQIAKFFNRAYSTIRGWLIKVVRGGLPGRYDKPPPGAPCKLDDSQLVQLRKALIAGPRSCGFESGVWTTPLVVKYVQKKYKVQYAETGMYDLLCRLGFSSRKPRPIHPKSASESEKKEFKKKARQTARYYSDKGYTVLAQDESSHILGWNVKNGWYEKGRPISTPISLSKERFYSFGALSEDEFLCVFYDKANSDTFCDFLYVLKEEFGKALLFVDNASYHKSKKVKETIQELKKSIVVQYLPPYTPELNPVEGQWRNVKRSTANTRYENTKKMQKSIKKMIWNGEITIAKMSGYLTM